MKKNASLFLTMKEGEGGASFSFLTLSVWGSSGNCLSALKKFSARKGVNNYEEKWKVVASKETTLTVQVLFPIYCNPSCKGLLSPQAFLSE